MTQNLFLSLAVVAAFYLIDKKMNRNRGYYYYLFFFVFLFSLKIIFFVNV